MKNKSLGSQAGGDVVPVRTAEFWTSWRRGRDGRHKIKRITMKAWITVSKIKKTASSSPISLYKRIWINPKCWGTKLQCGRITGAARVKHHQT